MIDMQSLLKLTVEKGASDLHITAGAAPQLRIDEKLVKADEEILTPERSKELVYSLLGPEAVKRFEERLKYELNIGNASSFIEIPPMMIQTLVENGIKHGISKITSGGEINISSKVENSLLYIEIRNNGHIEDDALKNSKGFGISNTKHRLNLLFGEAASFSLTNENGEKVLAKLKIPISPDKNGTG